MSELIRSILPISAAVLLIGSSLPDHVAVQATRVGDRHHGNTDTGLFYFFGTEITIVDPESGDIVKTLPGASRWGDTVYMRDQAQIRHYAFANDRENQDMVVIDCDSQEILSSIDTGDSPVHIYAIPSREEVWTHPDTNGTFDIVHMSDVSYLSHSHLEVHDEMPGHGKLLWDPNLQDQAFATNTAEPYIYEVDLDEKAMTSIVNMTLASAPYPCARTHGIGYSWVNDHLYVECSHPEACGDAEVPDYTDGTVCSGSTWEVDVETLTPVARLVSPALNDKYGDSFGAQGQVYVTPDEQFAVLTNKYHNFVHFLQPVSNGDTNFVEVEVAGTPGKVEFWPKGEDVWGPDSSVADYYVVIAQEEQVDDSGIIMIDLAEILEAFESEDGLPDVTVTYIPVGAGATYRPLARGADFAATVTNGTSPYGGYTGVAIVDLVDQSVKHTFDIADVGRLLWVPTHDDEQVALQAARITILESDMAEVNEQVSSITAQTDPAVAQSVDKDYGDVEILAEAALAVAVVGALAGLMALVLTIKTGRQAKVASGGEFKPFICF